MSENTIAFIGLGLIGGSIARGVKRVRPNTRILAYSRTRARLEQALADGNIDVILDTLGEELRSCDMIFLCTPVEYNAGYLEAVKPYLKPGCILTDVGSTKTSIHEEVRRLNLEEYFIGGHPMAGSEKTGYENSTDHLLENAYYVITPTSKSSEANVQALIRLASDIGALPIRLDYRQHDYVVAAVSHLPHVIASSLVNLVRDTDSPEEIMKRVAAGGFKDITRIASASPVMWEQICMTNADNIAVLLERYIRSLQSILQDLRGEKKEQIRRLFDDSREYRNSISDKGRGPIEREYSFYLDIVDEPGAISTIAVILSAKGINISNIGIIHSREYEEGVLKIVFYDDASMQEAWQLLSKHNYILYER